MCTGGFRVVRAGSAPLPLWATDWRLHSRSCLLMLNFDRSTIKRGTQNIQNDWHQWLSDSFSVHQIRFRQRLRCGPHWESLQRSPDPLAGLRGHTSKGRGRRGEMERRRGEERDGRDRPLLQIPGSALMWRTELRQLCAASKLYCR